ncbi:excinuclease ABC subunit UvrC [Paracoccus aminovorans]|uniref:excinuclease ABC subunit UvrC n=1 Tax=Paracoccus aminovorans TaxID=34004 RepID=UPI0007840BB9|nr:excinuclease ABC subunit UvrC [Paracoccus aminovorans]MDQ7776396.1 excinuclease ABC subunit UvrC [Paracoccus aminovorans]
MTDSTPDKRPAKTGHTLIQDYLKTLDGSPGVYRMLDGQGAVLYVGKARNLRARVSNYARPAGHSGRIARMIRETCSMMFLTTRTETEALLLEQNLIKQLKPRYNVLLRDDKSFPNILVAKAHPFAQIKKHRGAKSEKGDYYGPFASAGAVNRTLNQLQRVFLLRSCTDATFSSRTRPCLLYQIKRCSAPCVGRIEQADYAALVLDAERFLQGKSTAVQANLAREMAEAAEAMEYERAAALRDRIKALTAVQSVQAINPRGVPEADVIALHMEGGQACVQVFFIRGNQSWGNRDFYPRLNGVESADEVMQAFIAQFYDGKVPPRMVLLSHGIEDPDLMAEILTAKAGRKVVLGVPQRGEKAELVENALRNARESLARRMSESAAQARLLEGLAEAFDLPAVPQRIEVYDNSHIQGTNAVGGMVVAGPEGWIKSQYRKFNIKGTEITPGDDFGMMKEVLTRRFSRLLKEDPDRQTDAWPDLLLIDGGAGQVSAVHQIMADMGVEDIPMVGVAKGLDRDHGKEEFHRFGQRPFALRMNDPVLYFVQRLRDEAHRWAIGTHRAKRAKAVMANPLDEIAGVGASRKRALLQHFGSAKAVSRAGLADLVAVEGISESLAQKIVDHFQKG